MRKAVFALCLATISAQCPGTVSKTELATHNAAGNCWLSIKNVVYDVSNYRNHPVPLAPTYCGKDVTATYNTIGKHSIINPSSVSVCKGALVDAPAPTNRPTNPAATNPPTNPPAQGGPTQCPGTVTKTELATHNAAGNCWLSITNVVYDVSNYRNHPVPLAPTYCGKDVTVTYNTVAKHSRINPSSVSVCKGALVDALTPTNPATNPPAQGGATCSSKGVAFCENIGRICEKMNAAEFCTGPSPNLPPTPQNSEPSCDKFGIQYCAAPERQMICLVYGPQNKMYCQKQLTTGAIQVPDDADSVPDYELNSAWSLYVSRGALFTVVVAVYTSVFGA